MTHHYTPTATIEATKSAASYLADNWGDHGYQIGLHSTSWNQGRVVFLARHRDGEWYIAADPYGNCAHGDTAEDAERALREKTQ